MDLLMRLDWPGNVRELENAVERALVVGRGQEIRARTSPSSPGRADSMGRTLEDVERAHIERILRETDHNLSRAARSSTSTGPRSITSCGVRPEVKAIHLVAVGAGSVRGPRSGSPRWDSLCSAPFTCRCGCAPKRWTPCRGGMPRATNTFERNPAVAAALCRARRAGAGGDRAGPVRAGADVRIRGGATGGTLRAGLVSPLREDSTGCRRRRLCWRSGWSKRRYTNWGTPTVCALSDWEC